MPTVASLHVYPIKSCRGLDLTGVRFDPLGPLYDRRFMVVDEQGAFLTQREVPKLAVIAPRHGPTALVISALCGGFFTVRQGRYLMGQNSLGFTQRRAAFSR